MGHVFTSSKQQMRALRRALIPLLRVALRGQNSKTVLQNEENRTLLVSERIVPIAQTAVIRGSGVNVKRFVPTPEPAGPPVILLAARMLWDKGIGDFVEASRLVRSEHPSARFVLVGKPDPESPGSISETQLAAWADSGVVEWWGHQDDMASVFAQANIVCLPSSYGEGIPKVLVEAASCGRAVVATDVPGCRDVVRDGENGFVVPVHNPRVLAAALKTLVRDDGLRKAMGVRGREIATSEFSEEIVIRQTFAVYRELLGTGWADAYPLLRVGDKTVSETAG
jgi:glycosyltransferase involved in cell wall biosynthesis